MQVELNREVAHGVSLGPDCTIRSIETAYDAVRAYRPAGDRVRLDCGGVAQADLTFVQLVVSAGITFAAQGAELVVDPVSEIARAAFARAGVVLPGPDRSALA